MRRRLPPPSFTAVLSVANEHPAGVEGELTRWSCVNTRSSSSATSAPRVRSCWRNSCRCAWMEDTSVARAREPANTTKPSLVSRPRPSASRCERVRSPAASGAASADADSNASTLRGGTAVATSALRRCRLTLTRGQEATTLGGPQCPVLETVGRRAQRFVSRGPRGASLSAPYPEVDQQLPGADSGDGRGGPGGIHREGGRGR